MPVDYQCAKIYRIFSKSAGLVYYGSTCQSVSQRIGEHRRAFKRRGKMSCTYSVFIVMECDDWEYETVLNCPCSCKKELSIIEGKYIRENECVNQRIEGRTLKEWYEDNQKKIKKYREDNKDKIKEQNKKHYEDNKEKIKEWGKKYREDNKDKIKEQRKKYREDNKDKIKEQRKKYHKDNQEKIREKDRVRSVLYYKNNKEKISEKHKKYREDNKEKISERGKIKTTCECGAVVGKYSLNRHKKSKKHMVLLCND